MPNIALPGWSPKAVLQRSAQRSDSSIARSISFGFGRQRDAFVELHLDVGIEQALDLDRALRRHLVGAPSICERKVTPFSVSLRSLASDITWKPPLSVRIGCGQRANSCRPPSRATRSAPGRSIR